MKIDQSGWNLPEVYWANGNQFREWGFKGIPFVALVDGSGKIIVADHPGAHNLEDLILKNLNPFAGKGATIGGGSAGQTTEKVQITDESGAPSVDHTKPKTLIKVRLHNGQAVKFDVNLDHTVADIAKYVEKVAPVTG